LCKILDLGIGACNLSGISNGEVFDLIPKELQEYGKSFLYELQLLHDEVRNWDSEGLSDIGKLKMKQIKIDFNLN
jgi:hypothetical protein